MPVPKRRRKNIVERLESVIDDAMERSAIIEIEPPSLQELVRIDNPTPNSILPTKTDIIEDTDDSCLIEDLRGEIDSIKPSIASLFKTYKSLPTNLWNVWDEFIAIPDPEVQKPMALAYALLPSVLCTTIPILCLQGDSGSGKTEHSKIYARIHNVDLLTQNTSYAGLRDTINDRRFPPLDEDAMQGLSSEEKEPFVFNQDGNSLLLLSGKISI